MRRGYFLAHRKWLESEIWKRPPIYNRIWHWILAAADEEGNAYVSLNAIRQGVAWFGQGGRTTFPPQTTVRRVLVWMVEKGMVEWNPPNNSLSVCNWNEYQWSARGQVATKNKDIYIFKLPNVAVTYAEHAKLEKQFPGSDLITIYLEISAWCRKNDKWPKSIVPLVLKWVNAKQKKGADGKPRLIY